MMIRWWEHSEKGVTDRRKDERTDRRTKVFLELLGRSYNVYTILEYIPCLLLGRFYKHGLTLILAWISNQIPNKVLDQIACPFPAFNGCTIEVFPSNKKFESVWIMDEVIHPTLYNECDNLSMLGLKLFHVCKGFTGRLITGKITSFVVDYVCWRGLTCWCGLTPNHPLLPQPPPPHPTPTPTYPNPPIPLHPHPSYTHIPLTVWIRAVWYETFNKNCV